MNELLTRTEKIMERILRLASFSEDNKGITRTYGRQAFRDATQQVKLWMEEAGLDTRIDTLGNVRGRKTGEEPTGKTFILASHIDSVVNAGKFDGPLGVVMALDMIESLPPGKLLPFNIELIAFCDEEGVRFHTTYLGSKLVAGSFDESLLEKKDGEGITLQQVIKELGGDLSKIKSDALDPGQCLGYFEIHIEQGPVLYEKKIPAAVVTAIAGQLRAELIFRGEAGHAGTVPLNMRRDALCAAAESILAIEAMAKGDHTIMATVGTLQVLNAASNVIPGEVHITLDLRSASPERLSASAHKIKSALSDICSRRHIDFEWKPVQQSAPVLCDEKMIEQLAASIADSGYEVVKLVSGAGHDAVPMSAVTPVCMMFVSCYKGISHNPLEQVEAKDITASLEIADRFLAYQIKNYHP